MHKRLKLIRPSLRWSRKTPYTPQRRLTGMSNLPVVCTSEHPVISLVSKSLHDKFSWHHFPQSETLLSGIFNVECMSGVHGQPPVWLFDVVITAMNHQDSQQRSERALTVTPGGQSPEKMWFILAEWLHSCSGHNMPRRGNQRCESNHINLGCCLNSFFFLISSVKFLMTIQNFSKETRKKNLESVPMSCQS